MRLGCRPRARPIAAAEKLLIVFHSEDGKRMNRVGWDRPEGGVPPPRRLRVEGRPATAPRAGPTIPPPLITHLQCEKRQERTQRRTAGICSPEPIGGIGNDGHIGRARTPAFDDLAVVK